MHALLEMHDIHRGGVLDRTSLLASMKQRWSLSSVYMPQGCRSLSLCCAHLQMHIRVVEAVVGRLLMAACADGSIAVRRAILHSVQEPSSLDIYLAQADA